ncbi:hypothetical protein [Paenibacillus oryzae]|uniref:hypothetical protein n=1 Tax=Paenibacillus oryzae TaxID=1844972 RepID=UPI0012EA723B|nr:hypothetical protein [Paenibacillus oryzae]
MAIITQITGILVLVLFIGLLLTGMLVCRKYQFKAGFYFFLLLIIPYSFNSFFSPTFAQFINSYMDSRSLPFGMSLGEAVAWFSFIPKMIEIIAFSILVVGLYRLWRFRTAPQK